VQADYKTKKEREAPNICLSLLHDAPTSLLTSIAAQRFRHKKNKKAFCLEPCHRVPTAELKGIFLRCVCVVLLH